MPARFLLATREPSLEEPLHHKLGTGNGKLLMSSCKNATFFVFMTIQEHGFIFQVLSYLRFCLQNQEKSNKFWPTINYRYHS